MFATCDLAIGELILSERPLVCFESSFNEYTFKKTFDSLDNKGKEIINSLAFHEELDDSPL